MKLDTRSKEVRAIMVLIFVLIFINTGILVLLSQVSFVELDGGRTLLSKIFNKPEGATDFSMDWYLTAGEQLTKTMTIQSIYPLGEYFGFSNLLKFKRWKDRGFTDD
jgi:hypothetical protein